MKIITEQEYKRHPQNGCELVAEVFSNVTNDPIYIIIEDERSLNNKVANFFEKEGVTFENLRIQYVFKPSPKDGDPIIV